MTPNTPRLLAASVFLGCTLQAAPARTGPSYSPWARCVCTARLTGTGPCCGEEADQTLKRAGRARPLTAPPARPGPRPPPPPGHGAAAGTGRAGQHREQERGPARENPHLSTGPSPPPPCRRIATPTGRTAPAAASLRPHPRPSSRRSGPRPAPGRGPALTRERACDP